MRYLDFLTHSRLTPCLTLVALLASLVTPLVAEDWPQWRGPGRDAKSTETGFLHTWPEKGPELAWSSNGLGVGYSTLAVADGRLFTMGDIEGRQYLLALSAKDGSLLWKVDVGKEHKCQYNFHGSRGTPTVDGKVLYAVSTDGLLVALDTKTGKEIWKKSLPDDFGGKLMNKLWGWSESPLIDGEKLIVTPGGEKAGMVALHKKTGEVIWKSKFKPIGEKGADGAGFSSAVISEAGGVRQYVQLTGRGVLGVEAETGRFLWGYNKVANDIANIPTPVVSGNLVFASTSYDTGSALVELSQKDGDFTAKEVYFLPPNEMQNHHGGFILHEGYLYSGNGHNKGFPLCIELKTGKVAWGPVRNDGKGSAAVAFVDGHLIYRYQSGHVVLIEATPEEYREKGSFQLPEIRKESWPHPVIADGLLYLRENDNLFVYNLADRPSIKKAETKAGR